MDVLRKSPSFDGSMLMPVKGPAKGRSAEHAGSVAPTGVCGNQCCSIVTIIWDKVFNSKRADSMSDSCTAVPFNCRRTTGTVAQASRCHVVAVPRPPSLCNTLPHARHKSNLPALFLRTVPPSTDAALACALSGLEIVCPFSTPSRTRREERQLRQLLHLRHRRTRADVQQLQRSGGAPDIRHALSRRSARRPQHQSAARRAQRGRARHRARFVRDGRP